MPYLCEIVDQQPYSKLTVTRAAINVAKQLNWDYQPITTKELPTIHGDGVLLLQSVMMNSPIKIGTSILKKHLPNLFIMCLSGDAIYYTKKGGT